MTIDEAAAALHMSRATLYRQLARAGRHSYLFPSASGGTRAFVRQADVEHLHTARQHPTAAGDAGGA
jgi:AraC-like DNA-binding protein